MGAKSRGLDVREAHRVSVLVPGQVRAPRPVRTARRLPALRAIESSAAAAGVSGVAVRFPWVLAS